ncbi:Protein of unknown function [Lactobacillus helveticus CIRM-BIA 103]|nr:Protein of unknown function [Lactobacillus helveticus CIRM-BIA 103]
MVAIAFYSMNYTGTEVPGFWEH